MTSQQIQELQPRLRPGDWKHDPISLKGKAVLVTGGTTGIGRATVNLLAAEGARVFTYGRDAEHLNDALKDAQHLGEVHGITADQAKEEDVRRVFEQVEQKLGGLDVLIANAALPGESVTDTDYQQIEYVVRTNLLGHMFCSKLAVEAMQKRGGGQIVAIGSMSAEVRETGSDVYVATKSGIEGFCGSLRKILSDKPIRLSLIEPGSVGTDLPSGGKADPKKQREKEEQGRMLTAEDIAECVYYCLTQPSRCDVVEVRIRPHGQAI